MNIQAKYTKGLTNIKALKVAPTKPTPHWIRKLGTLCLTLGAGLTALAAHMHDENLATIAFIAGILLKGLSNLFGE